MPDSQSDKSNEFHSAFFLGIVTQFGLILLAAMCLDGGRLMGLTVTFAVGYFIVVLWIGLKRPHTKAKSDIAFIRIAPLVLFFVAILLCHFGLDLNFVEWREHLKRRYFR